MLFNEPKLLKSRRGVLLSSDAADVSVLFNEPKIAEIQREADVVHRRDVRFSALQRAEIAEIFRAAATHTILT